MKTILAVVGVIVLIVAGYLFLQWRAIQQAATGPAKELLTESIVKTGDTWHVSFSTKFDAPVDKVYEAFSQPERVPEYAPDNVLKSELVKSEGNSKTIDLVARLDILPPGFKVQNIRYEWTFFPAEKRITSKSIDFKLADFNNEYKFEPSPDGKGTILKFNQTSKDKAPMLVESLQKGALRETYLIQVRAANKAIGIAPADEKKQAG
jgi:Polyketide cyclase / dehydrase and lipid transport